MNNIDTKGSNTVQALWLTLASLGTFFVSIVSAIILSRYLEKSEYGTYRQILFIYTTLSFVFSAGLPRVFQYFLPRRSIEEGALIVKKINTLLLILGLTFSLTLFTLSKPLSIILNNPELEIGLKYFSPVPTFLLPTLGIEGIFSSYRKTQYISYYNLFSGLLQLTGIVLPVILLGGGYINAIYGWVGISVLLFLFTLYYKNIPFKGIATIKTNTIPINEILSYSIPLVVASIAGLAIKAADQYYISRYFGPEIFAEYTNGFIELPFVFMITGATSAVVMPLFSKIIHDKSDINNLITLWKSAILKSATLIYPLVIFFFTFANQTMEILFSTKYAHSVNYFRINLILNLFNIVIFAPLFFSMGKTKLYATIHIILAIIIWIIDYLLVSFSLSSFSIAIANTTIHIIKILVFISIGSRLLKIRFIDLFPVKYLIKLLIHSSLSIGTTLLVFKFVNLSKITLIVYLIISGIIYILTLLMYSRIFNIQYFNILKPIITKISVFR